MKKVDLKRIIIHLILMTGALFMIIPFLWMLLTSFKTAGNSIAYPPRLIPDPFTLESYKDILDKLPIFRFYLNSILYTIGRIIPSILFCSFAGFIFAKAEFRGKNLLFFLIISCMIFPIELRITSLYNLIDKLRWVDTYQAVIFPNLMEPFGIFLFRQTIRDVPDDLIYSAQIDGCGIFKIYRHIILKVITPTLAAYMILCFIWSWGDFLWPLIILISESKYPIEVGIKGLSDYNFAPYNAMMAGATLAVLPIIIFFIIMQRYFIKGMTLTGLKEG